MEMKEKIKGKKAKWLFKWLTSKGWIKSTFSPLKIEKWASFFLFPLETGILDGQQNQIINSSHEDACKVILIK